MNQLFDFDPSQYSETFARQGYVHIRAGLNREYLAVLTRQVEEYMQSHPLPDYARGNKQQALYQFPQSAEEAAEEGSYYRQLYEAVGGVCGLAPERLVVSERHIKVYEPDSVPDPAPHKDRYASQVAVGFAVHVPQGSKLVLYPRDPMAGPSGPNPFVSSKELRESLAPDRLPERCLQPDHSVMIEGAPGDVLMFCGSAMWHLRQNPANSKMVYFKMNDFNCDPLGEDPFTGVIRQRSLELLSLSSEAMAAMIPMVGRRVDAIQRRYTRDWRQSALVVFADKRQLLITDDEMLALQSMDGKRNFGAAVSAMDDSASLNSRFDQLRRLVRLDVIDVFDGSISPFASRSTDHPPQI